MNTKSTTIKKGLSLLYGLFLSGCLMAQILPDSWNQANGTVNKAVYDEVNNRMYIAGAFTMLYPQTPDIHSGFTFDLTTAEGAPLLPYLDGPIYKSCNDGNGGLFIAGDFTSIGGFTRNGIAHIDASGSVTSWDAGITGNCTVLSLEVYGSKLYVGGIFNNVQGQGSTNIVVLDKVSGAIIPWSLSCSSNVYAIESNGGYVYIGSYGLFSCPSSPSVNAAARIDTLTGVLDSWNPIVNGGVYSFGFDNNHVYLGGYISQIGGQSRIGIARVMMSDASLDSWNPLLDYVVDGSVFTPKVDEMEVYGTELIIRGAFSSINGTPRTYLASFDLQTGNLSSWSPSLDATTNSMLISGQNLFISGGFWFVDNTIQSGIAKIDLPSKELLSWDPKIEGGGTLSLFGGELFMGGGAIQTGYYIRPGLAAIDLTTGLPTDWKPIPDLSGQIYDLAIKDSILYVGGRFHTMDNQTRNNLAAYNLNTLELSTWNPDADTSVNTLFVTDSLLFAGGEFTAIGGINRGHIAAFDLVNGSLENIDFSANGKVSVIEKIGGHIYVGGLYSEISGASRSNVSRFTTSDLQLDQNWVAETNGKVNTFCENENGILIGGDFSAINDSTRNNLGAVNYTTGYIQPLDISADGIVTHIGRGGDRVFVLGEFNNIGGQNRPMLAELDVQNALVTPWYLPVNPWAPTGKNMLSIDSVLLFTGSFGMAYDSLQIPDYTSIPTTISQFVFPAIPDVCNGLVYLNAQGAPDFDFFIDDNYVGTSVGFLSPDTLCPGIHSLSVVNYFGDTTFAVLSVPVDTNYFLINPFSGEIINDLLGLTVDNCELDFNNIDTIYIEESYVNNDTIVAVWHVEMFSDTIYDTLYYPLTNGNGNYYLQINIFCPTRAVDDIVTATHGVIVSNDGVYLEVEKPEYANEIIVSPNPTTGTLIVHMSLPECVAELYDFRGRVLHKILIHKGDVISIDNYESGVYFLKIVTSKGTFLERIIKH